MSRAADDIITNVIVERGMSYADAVRWCENEADRISAPYDEAANKLRSELARLNALPDEGDSQCPRS